MRIDLFILFVAMSLPLQAGLYKWTDAEGQVHYGDRPVEDAEPVRVPGVKFRTDLQPARAPADADADAPAADDEPAGAYREFELVEPATGTTLRSAEGEVPISVIIDPPLQSSHHMRLSLDGQVVKGLFNSTQIILRKVALGSHQLQATIVDSEQREIATSNAVSFHMRRPSDRKPLLSP